MRPPPPPPSGQGCWGAGRGRTPSHGPPATGPEQGLRNGRGWGGPAQLRGLGPRVSGDGLAPTVTPAAAVHKPPHTVPRGLQGPAEGPARDCGEGPARGSASHVPRPPTPPSPPPPAPGDTPASGAGCSVRDPILHLAAVNLVVASAAAESKAWYCADKDCAPGERVLRHMNTRNNGCPFYVQHRETEVQWDAFEEAVLQREGDLIIQPMWCIHQVWLSCFRHKANHYFRSGDMEASVVVSFYQVKEV